MTQSVYTDKKSTNQPTSTNTESAKVLPEDSMEKPPLLWQMLFRILFALFNAPSYAIVVGILYSIGVGNFDGGSSYEFFFSTIISTPILFILFLFLKNGTLQKWTGGIAVLVWFLFLGYINTMAR